MGNSQSLEGPREVLRSIPSQLNEKVTWKRIRRVFDPKRFGSKAEHIFSVYSLADDLNKLGLNIAVRMQDGSKRPVDNIMQDIRNITMFNADGVCTLSASAADSKIASKRILQLVDIANKYFGSSIVVFKNPLNPAEGMRSNKDLCNDLYIVQDTLHRRLTGEYDAIKSDLTDQIEKINDAIDRLKQNKNALSGIVVEDESAYNQIVSENLQKLNNYEENLKQHKQLGEVLEKIESQMKGAEEEFKIEGLTSAVPLYKAYSSVAQFAIPMSINDKLNKFEYERSVSAGSFSEKLNLHLQRINDTPYKDSLILQLVH